MNKSSQQHRYATLAMTCLVAAMTSFTAQARIIALDIEITMDKVSPQRQNMGGVHKARVFYDDTKIDAATKRVPVIHEQHTPMMIPKHLNPGQMPMSNAWLDLSSQPYKYHFAAAPTTGFPDPYFILFDEKTMRMTIYDQKDGSMLLSGIYKVLPTPITGPEIDAVVAKSDPVTPPWITTVPGMPGGAGGPAGH